MPTVTQQLLPNANHEGVDPFGPAPVTLAAQSRVVIRVESSDFTDPAERIKLDVELSPDGVNDWRYWCGFEGVGGQIDRHTGLPAVPSTSAIFPAGTFHIRGALNTTGRVRYGLFADVTPTSELP